MVFALVACNTSNGEQTSPKSNVKGVGDVDVVNTHGRIEGWEQMEAFYDQMQKGVNSDLRIVHYTTEGDPMVTDLTYDGESLEVKHDTTRDKYGNGAVNTKTCGGLIKETNPTNTSYIATDCTGVPYEMDEVLGIRYNSSQQDRFDVELKYGEDLENEISTVTNTVKKEKSGTEKDVDLPDRIMQEVYKRLVFANYLAEKDLDSTCEIENDENYQLKVYINGGQREYRWAGCDQSKDGKRFTEIAQYIIEQSEKKDIEKQDTVIQGYVIEMKDDQLLIGEEMNRLDYEQFKNEIQQMDLEGIIFDFTYIKGMDTEDFQLGDKIRATVEGNIVGSNPGKATVKEVKKIEID